MKNYFYVTESHDGWQNLAVDEYLLNSLRPGELCLLLYVNENAVILGKNQNPWAECDLEKMRTDGVQLVRRCTGGGAVFHDSGNLNYSFIAHESRYDEPRQMALILHVLKSFGINAKRSGRNDLTAEERKFSGTAYCTKGDNRQQHGTLLINADLTRLSNYLTVAPQKLESKGVKSVRSRVVNLRELSPGITVGAVAAALEKAFTVEYGEAVALVLDTEAERDVTELFERNRSWAWQLGKAPAFDYTYENRFEWGMARLCINIKNGMITGARLYIDALDTNLPEKISSALHGQKFSLPDIEIALRIHDN